MNDLAKLGKLTVNTQWAAGWSALEMQIVINGTGYRMSVDESWMRQNAKLLTVPGQEPGFVLQSAFLSAVLRKIGYGGPIPFEAFQDALFPVKSRNAVVVPDERKEITYLELKAGLREYTETRSITSTEAKQCLT